MERNVQPPLHEVRAHYDEWNAKWRNADFEAIEPEIRRRAERVLELLEERGAHFPRILEVGCGTGWMSRRLASMGEVTGIDLSPKAIEIAWEHGVEAELIAGDFLEHDFGQEPFDLIVVIETLFYVQDQRAAVEKMADLLRPGGQVAFTCINPFVYERRSDVGPPHPGQPRHWLTIDEMRGLLSDRFEIETLQTMDPGGNQGILKFANSYKLSRVAESVFGETGVRRFKERRGWGRGVVIVARRR